ncbi:MAG: hypothetical protein Q4G35_04205 [Propionibacteriaceae bacterium]|nr:hypothetical protein [Propionibacteriaceae bacterium]
MELAHLKDLLEETPSQTSVSPRAVAAQVDRRRHRIQRGAAALTVVAVVGAGGVALAMQTGPNAIPVSPAAPAPDPGEGEGGSPATDESCIIEAPPSWDELIDETRRRRIVDVDGPWLERTRYELTWHRGGQSITFAHDVNILPFSAVTDGRYVVYRSGGRALLWDSENPGWTGRELPGSVIEHAWLDDGKVWLADFENDPGSPRRITNLRLVTLSEGIDATWTLRAADLEPVGPVLGGLQVRSGEQPMQLLQATGEVTELRGQLQDKEVLDTYRGSSGEVALVMDPETSETFVMRERPEPLPVNGRAIEGDWVLGATTVDEMERDALFNHRTGVTVVLPGGRDDYSLREGNLWVHVVGVEQRPLGLSALPEVTCG